MAKLLTTTEAAKVLGITRNGLHKIVARGELEPAGKELLYTGRYRRLFRPRDVAALKRSRATNPPKPGPKPAK